MPLLKTNHPDGEKLYLALVVKSHLTRQVAAYSLNLKSHYINWHVTRIVISAAVNHPNTFVLSVLAQ